MTDTEKLTASIVADIAQNRVILASVGWCVDVFAAAESGAKDRLRTLAWQIEACAPPTDVTAHVLRLIERAAVRLQNRL